MNEQSKYRIKEAHLSFIQPIITRMGQNSIQIKSWCITLITALITFYASNRTSFDYRCFIWVLVVANILFLLMDVYYLALEKGYRHLYKVVAGIESYRDVIIKDYDTTLPEQFKEIKMLPEAIRSISIRVFYLLLFLGQGIILLSLN